MSPEGGEEKDPPPSHETPAHRLRNLLSIAAIGFLILGFALVALLGAFAPRGKGVGVNWWLAVPAAVMLGGFAICVLAWAATLVMGFARFGLRSLLVISGLAGFCGYLATSVPKYEALGWIGLALLVVGVVAIVLVQVIRRDDKDPFWNKYKK